MTTTDQKTFLHKNVRIFNDLPREITLSTNIDNFKKWLKKFYLEKEIQFPVKNDHIDLKTYTEINLSDATKYNIFICENIQKHNIEISEVFELQLD